MINQYEVVNVLVTRHDFTTEEAEELVRTSFRENLEMWENDTNSAEEIAQAVADSEDL